MLCPEDKTGTNRGKNAGRTLAGLRQRLSLAACRGTDLVLCDAAEEGQRKRNSLGHSEIGGSEDGPFAAWRSQRRGVREPKWRFKVEQINGSLHASYGSCKPSPTC